MEIAADSLEQAGIVVENYLENRSQIAIHQLWFFSLSFETFPLLCFGFPNVF